jgi:hypothetical protein
MSRRITILGLGLVAVVVLLAYKPAFGLSFVGDDWIFYELAGRLSLHDYLVRYLDPAAQTAWYRPLQGVLFRLAYDVLGTDPSGYHLGNILFHLSNCLLLFAIVVRAINQQCTALVAALLFASFPTAVEGVFKPGVVDPLTTFCSLVATWFWLNYLRGDGARHYWLALLFFVLALSSKEIAIGLPLIFFLIDRYVVRAPTDMPRLLLRYVWFLLVLVAYIPIEMIVIGRSVFVAREGYALGWSAVSNLLDYLGSLAFPWFFPAPLNYIWLAAAAGVLAYLIFNRKAFSLIPLIATAVLPLVPILSFPFATNRFLYLPLTASAILGGAGFDWLHGRLDWAWAVRASIMIPAICVCVGALGVSNAAVDFAEFARVTRVPFRNVSQAHPTFAEDTLLYFVEPPIPGPNLSGMFFWRYGSRVTVRADDMSGRAGLRDHAIAFVYIFDKEGNQKEMPVAEEIDTQVTPTLPVNLSNEISLDGYELVSAKIERDQPIVLLLYWRALSKTVLDYQVSVRLLNLDGVVVATHLSEPRNGKSPTRSWSSGDLIVDSIQLPIINVPPNTYRLEIALSYAGSMSSPSSVVLPARANSDRVIIEFIKVLE